MQCPRAGEPAVTMLHDFRAIQRLPGPKVPPAYQVAYRCGVCSQRHIALMDMHELDLAPVNSPFAPHHELASGQMDWFGSLADLWAEAVRLGSWPLHLHCPAERRGFGGWPSLLSCLEPDDDRRPSQLLVSYRCPHCGEVGVREMTPDELSLIPPV